MGTRGPLPKPNPRHHIKRPEPTGNVTPGRPAIPASLKGEARAEWKRIVPELASGGLLATVDRAALIRHCIAWAHWCELRAEVDVAGFTVFDGKGKTVVNPAFRAMLAVEKTLAELSRQLGLTPVARIRANIGHEQPATEPGVGPTAIEEYRQKLQG